MTREIFDDVDKEWLLRSAIRMTSRMRKLRRPLWSIVGELTSHGMGNSVKICRELGWDPHAMATDELPDIIGS